jgi:hypothetical protein
MGVIVPKNDLILEGMEITFRNFAGMAGEYNPAGVRTYSVVLNDLEQARAIEAMGWKVRYPKPREDGSEPRYAATMPVTVKYHPKLAPPRVVMLTSRGQTKMGEEDIDILDFMNIKSCDMILRPYHWSGKIGEGVKNMCSSIYITIQEDALELKYADVPEIGPGAQQALTAGPDYSQPFEDLGEIAENQYALEQGSGF